MLYWQMFQIFFMWIKTSIKEFCTPKDVSDCLIFPSEGNSKQIKDRKSFQDDQNKIAFCLYIPLIHHLLLNWKYSTCHLPDTGNYIRHQGCQHEQDKHFHCFSRVSPGCKILTKELHEQLLKKIKSDWAGIRIGPNLGGKKKNM